MSERGSSFDAVIVGSGPNGLTAANVLADAGCSVLVLEAKETIGGGTRSAELTEPGFLSDICSAIHPLGAASPVFRDLELERFGLEWLHPEIPLAHPFEDGTAASLHRSLERTAEELGIDGSRYHALLAPFVSRAEALFDDTLRPIRFPRRPLLMARFGWLAIRSSDGLVRRFRNDRTRALFGGSAAHSVLALETAGTAAFGLMLSIAGHAVGWPCARGGSRSIAGALADRLRARGGEIRTEWPVESLDDVPASRVVLFDLTPRQVIAIAGEALPPRYVRRLARFRYGPGVFKVDWSLDGPIPWAAEACRRAGTVHVAGTYDELSLAEGEAAAGVVPERPFVLVAQQSLFDPSRAPAGKHVAWGYCHVPHGSTVDMTDRIEAQIERFAPGFRDVIRARRTAGPKELEAYNPNMIGGDVGGGANDLRQFLARPIARMSPYRTPNPRLYLCSSSTSPGGGVHGMCGYWAARAALSDLGLPASRSPALLAASNAPAP